MDAIQPKERGTKVAGYYKLTLKAGQSHTIHCRLMKDGQQLDKPFANFDDVFNSRKKEADAFYSHVLPGNYRLRPLKIYHGTQGRGKI